MFIRPCLALMTKRHYLDKANNITILKNDQFVFIKIKIFPLILFQRHQTIINLFLNKIILF